MLGFCPYRGKYRRLYCLLASLGVTSVRYWVQHYWHLAVSGVESDVIVRAVLLCNQLL